MERNYSEYIDKFVKVVIKQEPLYTCVFGRVKNVNSEYLFLDRTTGQKLMISIKEIVFIL